MNARRHACAPAALLLVLVALGSGVSGCGSSASDSGTTVLQGKEGRPDVPVPGGQPPPRLVVVDLKKGSGTVAEDGGKLSVRYFSLAYRGHRILEDHWRGAPTTFELGGGQVIPAWERGLSGMRTGGRRELILPSRMSFTNAPLVYVIEAISVANPKRSAPLEHERVTPTGPKPAIVAIHGPAPRKLVVRKLKRGTGSHVKRGELLGVRFMDVNYRTGEVQDFWDATEAGTAPYHFVLGQGRVRKGWEIAIPGQRLGTRLELLLPSKLAYGDGARRYVVELIEREELLPEEEH